MKNAGRESRVNRIGRWPGLLVGTWLVIGGAGCTSSVQSAARVAVTVKTCPEVQGLVGQAAEQWQSSLGIDAGDAATMKSALDASRDLESRVGALDQGIQSACSTLATDLGASPVAADAPEQACASASQALKDSKSRLGPGATVAATSAPQCKPDCSEPCDPAAPKGPCAQSSVTVTVSQATDPEAAARYQQATQTFLAAIIALSDAQTNVKELIANARTAIELGLVTGQAVSSGDVASAAAAAVCVLPPLIKAKQRVDALRRDMRLMRDLAKLAGHTLPRTTSFDEPVVAHTSVGRGAPPTVPAPIEDRIFELFTFPDGGFAAQTPEGVVALPGGQLLLRTRPPRQVELSVLGMGGPTATYCAVGAGRRVACIKSRPLFNGNGQSTGSQLILLDSTGGEQVVASVGSQGSLTPDGIAFSSAGQLLFGYTQRDVQGNRSYEVARVVGGGRVVQLPFVPAHAGLEDLGSGRANHPITFYEFGGRSWLLYRVDRKLVTSPLDQPSYRSEIATLSAYDARPVTGGDGWLYVFYYEPKSRTARVASSKDGTTFKDLVLDTRESGWQLDAIPTPDGALAVYYYFRNTYNKGLRSASLHDGKLVRAPLSLMREDRWNAGWRPHLAVDRNHEVWLSYLSNVEADTRVWSHFDSPSNLLDYAIVGADDSDEEEFKNWFVQVGVGGWYTWWNLISDAPGAEELDGAATAHDASYDIAPALLLTANLEARIGPVDFGLSYAQNYLDDAGKDLGEWNRLLSGNVKIEELLPGHDVKVEGVWGSYHGRASRPADGMPDEELPVDTSYVDVHLFALNQWRIKYGLAFNRFTVPTPLYAYYADVDQTHYTFGTSALRDVSFNNIDLAVGYSKLDYLAKYENSYFGPALDATLAGGLSIVSFDPIDTPAGNVESALGLHARLNLQLGLIWMERFRALSGLGFYLRPSYLAEGGFISNGLSRPKDREQKDATEADVQASFMLYTLRHGPWLDAGIVW